MNLLSVKIYRASRNLVYRFGKVTKVYWACWSTFQNNPLFINLGNYAHFVSICQIRKIEKQSQVNVWANLQKTGQLDKNDAGISLFSIQRATISTWEAMNVKLNTEKALEILTYLMKSCIIRALIIHVFTPFSIPRSLKHTRLGQTMTSVSSPQNKSRPASWHIVNMIDFLTQFWCTVYISGDSTNLSNDLEMLFLP